MNTAQLRNLTNDELICYVDNPGTEVKVLLERLRDFEEIKNELQDSEDAREEMVRVAKEDYAKEDYEKLETENDDLKNQNSALEDAYKELDTKYNELLEDESV